MTEDGKAAARKAAFAARKAAKGRVDEEPARANLRAVLAAFRGRPLSGYMPIRTEIDPVPAMAGWSGPVGVPVIEGPGRPLSFARWHPGAEMVDGAFGASVPRAVSPMVPEVLIVPLLAFSEAGYRLGYGGGFYDRTLEGLRARGRVFAVGIRVRGAAPRRSADGADRPAARRAGDRDRRAAVRVGRGPRRFNRSRYFRSEGWFTPSVQGISPSSLIFTPSRIAALTPYSFGSSRRR